MVGGAGGRMFVGDKFDNVGGEPWMSALGREHLSHGYVLFSTREYGLGHVRSSGGGVQSRDGRPLSR